MKFLQHIPRPVAHVAVALAGVAAFFLAARAIDPGSSEAAAPAVTSPTQDGALLGELIGREHTIRIIATSDGPRYTILDARGRMLAQEVTAEEAAGMAPDANVPSMTAGPLMLADDEVEHW